MSTQSALPSRGTIRILVAMLLFSLPAKAAELLIFAAASTTEILDAAIANYSATNHHMDRIRPSYASSGALARQIDSGAPAHLFLSANDRWVRWLETRGRIPEARSSMLFGNRLVLIAPAGSRMALKIRPAFPLAEALGSGRLAIADPTHVPAGQYAREALLKLGIWDDISRRAARAPNVRAALALVERGEAAAGIVYRTDAIRNRRVRIVDSFPAETHAPIAYTLALLAPETDKAALAFFSYLQSPPARAIYRRFGFEVTDR